MVPQWVKMLLVAILVLFQTACPKHATKQPETSTVDRSHEQDGAG
jgi:hypothetical protein